MPANQNKADVVKDYIEWAVSKDYAVIDVNIPKYVTTDPVGGYCSPAQMPWLTNVIQAPGKYEDEDENRPTATEELAGYLWDNYIEYEYNPPQLNVTIS